MIFGDVDMFDALLGEVIDRALVALSQRMARNGKLSETQQKRRATHGTTFLRPDREYMRVFLYSLLNKHIRETRSTGSSPARQGLQRNLTCLKTCVL
jgi:hypothetical protein